MLETRSQRSLTGGTFNGLVELLLWRFVGCPDDLVVTVKSEEGPAESGGVGTRGVVDTKGGDDEQSDCDGPDPFGSDEWDAAEPEDLSQ